MIDSHWTIEEELKAMGAMMVVRGINGYFEDRLGMWPDEVLFENLGALESIWDGPPRHPQPLDEVVPPTPEEIERILKGGCQYLNQFDEKVVLAWMRKGVHRTYARYTEDQLPYLGDLFLFAEQFLREEQLVYEKMEPGMSDPIVKIELIGQQLILEGSHSKIIEIGD
jgi:hypothetical protein